MWTIIIVVCLIGAVIGYFALKEGIRVIVQLVLLAQGWDV